MQVQLDLPVTGSLGTLVPTLLDGLEDFPVEYS